VNDLDLIALGKIDAGPILPPHDFAIAFDRRSIVGQRQVFDQVSNRQTIGDLAGFTIYYNPHERYFLNLGE
jgi:hypothetical protein